jgi:hypothetical protein
MLLLALALTTASAAAPAAATPVINPKAGQAQNCPATSRYEASRRGKTPKAQKLNQLPDADVYRAVYRHIGGCEVPVIVKYRVSDR